MMALVAGGVAGTGSRGRLTAQVAIMPAYTAPVIVT